MSETKFTKGEWYAHPNGVGCGGIAIVSTPNGCVLSKSEDNANADLIAAAPEMYNTLQLFCDIANGKTEFSLDEIDIKEIENLLAKARGES